METESFHFNSQYFLMILIAVLGTYCFFYNKPEDIQGIVLRTLINFHCSNLIPNWRIC